MWRIRGNGGPREPHDEVKLARASWGLILVAGVWLAAACQSPKAPTRPEAKSENPTPASEARPPSEARKPVPTALPDYAAIVSDVGREPDDLALDGGRQPVELLAFAGVAPGMRVAEIAAGKGYTAELLARVVGPTGEVYAQNNRFVLEKFAEGPWSARLQKPVMKHVVRIDREFDSPLPEDVTELDAVFMILFYHDTVWMKTDRQQMIRGIHAALKPGGSFIVVDHSARAGDGVSQAQSLHRIEESVVVEEVSAEGFVLAESGTFLRNAEDARDWNAAPSAAGERRGSSDRFVLRFEKQ